MRKLAIVPAVVLVASLGVARPTAASPPPTATGAFTTLTDTATPIRTAGGNTFFAEVITAVYSGGLSGPYVDTDTFVVHSDGSFEGYGTEACSPCTIGGRTGAFTSVFSFSGSGISYRGHLTFTGGTGGLAGLRGEGAFQSDGSVSTYSYSYHFAP